MKKLIALLLALVMVMALAACGATENKETTPATTEATEEATEGATEEATEPTIGDIELMTYEEFAAAELDSPVKVEATIQAAQVYSTEYSNTSLYLQAEDGAYFVYRLACSPDEYETLTVGTKVCVTGFKAEWEGEVEITDATFEIVEGEGFTAEALDVTEQLASEDLIDYQNQKIAVKGATVKAIEYKNDEPGDDIYVTLTVGEADYSFCVEKDLTNTDSDVYKTVGELAEGDKVNVEGFLYWYQGPNPHVTAIEKA